MNKWWQSFHFGWTVPLRLRIVSINIKRNISWSTLNASNRKEEMWRIHLSGSKEERKTEWKHRPYRANVRLSIFHNKTWPLIFRLLLFLFTVSLCGNSLTKTSERSFEVWRLLRDGSSSMTGEIDADRAAVRLRVGFSVMRTAQNPQRKDQDGERQSERRWSVAGGRCF